MAGAHVDPDDATADRVGHGVGDEVVESPRDLVGVDLSDDGIACHPVDVNPFVLSEDPGRGKGIGDQVAQVDLGAVETHALGLQPGE